MSNYPIIYKADPRRRIYRAEPRQRIFPVSKPWGDQVVIPPDEYGPNLVPNGDFESWISAINLTDWTESIAGTSTVNRESVEVYDGTYSCRFDVDAANTYLDIRNLAIPLVASKTYRLRIVYKMSVAGKTASFYLRDSGGANYLQLNGTWGATQYQLLANKTDWFVLDIEFAAPLTLNFWVLLRREAAASSSIYWGLVSVQEKL